MLALPPFPEVPAAQRGTGALPLRYEDLSQDGRIMLPSLLHAGETLVWGKMVAPLPVVWRLREEGILPILGRMTVEGYPGPFGLVHPLSGTGGYQLAHTRRGDEVERLLLNFFAELSAPRDRISPTPPPGAGEVVLGGRFFSEHVFTRPFAPPAQRKVLRLDVPGLPEIPADHYPTRPLDAILSLPEGATPLEPGLTVDVLPIVFGLCHTDGNQHVNSLVYPRMFEEAAVRRLAALGVVTPLLARFVDVGYRKPCFAGDRVRIAMQAFSLGERWGVVGVFIPEGERAAPEQARPHCYVQMLFER
jgi:hypothetical protein